MNFIIIIRMSDITETALRSKWKKEGLYLGWKYHAKKLHVPMQDKDISYEFTISNLKIATGPLYFGFTLSFMISVLEYLHNIFIQKSNQIYRVI